MNDTPPPPLPKGYTSSVDFQTSGAISLLRGHCVYEHNNPERGWQFVEEDCKLYPKGRVTVAVSNGVAPIFEKRRTTPESGYSYFLPEVGVEYKGDFIVRSDTGAERFEKLLVQSEFDAYRKEYFRRTEPTPPEGYELYTGPDDGRDLPAGSKLWIDADKKWSIASDKVSAFPGPTAFYASPKTPTPPEGYELFSEAYNWQQLPAGSLMHVVGEWKPLCTLCAIPTRGSIYAVPKLRLPDVPKDPAPRLTILEEAQDLVNGDRQASYGDAYESFDRIAKMWSTYKGITITPKDVASMMILMKVSRSVTSSKRDNWTDIAGYAELGSQIEAREAAPE